jgi:uncharacterized protein YcbX
MRGQRMTQAFAGFGGVYGDRCYAFLSSGAIKGFPYLTAREKETMLRYSPVYRYPDRMLQPPNLADAEALPPGVTPLYADGEDLMLDVTTPDGELLAVNDPRLIDSLCEGLRDKHQLTLRLSHRAMTDCRPISLFSRQTAQQLSREVGVELDLRRFRANVYLDLADQKGFAENELVGRTLRIGGQTVIRIVDRDPRCKMITLDPETGDANPEVMRVLARAHEGKAGLYGAVMVEGTIRAGDDVTLEE